jgi:hypothetical protein
VLVDGLGVRQRFAFEEGGVVGDTVVPDSVPDAAFAAALRPYVEAVRR